MHIATSDSFSAMSLCECKIASALTRLATEKNLLGVALVTPVVSTIFMMVITLLMMTRF